MGLFQYKVKSSIKEHIKGIFNRNSKPRNENVMSNFSKDASQVNSLELNSQKNTGRHYGNRIHYLISKGRHESNQSNGNIVKHVEKAPEFGDSKVNSHPHKSNFPPTNRSTVDLDSRNSSTVSHNGSISYSKDNHQTYSHCRQSTGKYTRGVRKRSASRKSVGSVDKYNEKSESHHSKSRQYASEPLRKPIFPNQNRIFPQNTVKKNGRMNSYHSVRRNLNSSSKPKGSNFHGSRGSKSRSDYHNESSNPNEKPYWSSTSFSSDVSIEQWKRKNKNDDHKSNSKGRTWMFKPKNKTQLSAHKKNSNPQYNNKSKEERTTNKQTFKISTKFHNKRYETKIDYSTRSIRNSSFTGVESRRNTGAKLELTKAPMKHAQGQNKTLLTNTLCPQKRHEILSSNKPCVCMKVEKMKALQGGPVYYEWHKVEVKAVDEKIIKKLETSPSLDEFELMCPTKVSTGGQGTVAWVHLPRTTKQYALKFKLRQDKNDKTWFIERREAKLLQKIKHSFIVDTYHIYETDSALFMAFEYLSGGCLWHHIARIGVLPEGYAAYYAACILTALSYLHERGIVYRDMKAENIVLDYQHRPKLIDFGMSKYFPSVKREMRMNESGENKEPFESPIGKEVLHVTNSYWASPDIDSDDEEDDPPTRYYYAAYLAPEIYEIPTESNQFIDSWGLGYLLLEMVLGYGIFRPIPWANVKGQHLSQEWKLYLPSDLLKKLTPKCRSLIFKMLIRHPQSRLSLKAAMRHSFFCRIPWTNLHAFAGPNLSKFQNPAEFHKHHSKILSYSIDQRSKFFPARKSLNPHPIYRMFYNHRGQNRRNSSEVTSHKTNTGKTSEEAVSTHKIAGSRRVDKPRGDRVCYLENNTNCLRQARNP
ncbi:unnamed protein product [Rodentolepis nana]|uniref:non-specific serine/threonine protein kinase n=1 Tax=Rodentolepis nana TaxID=102285 RepID=A0A0R3TM15_RODNA|nr:unnamed protein product [Rodentolepis nana]